MRADKEKLVHLLIERTGLEREQVELQLQQLLGRIQDAAEQGKSFEIEGFGTFSVEEDTLTFVPADDLATEINHKYAGMKPIELIGAFKYAPEATEIQEEDPDSPESVFGIEETADPTIGKPPQEHTQQQGKDEETEVEAEAEAEEKPVSPEKEHLPSSSLSLDEEKAEEPPQPDEQPATKPVEEKASAKEKKESQDPIGKVLIAAVVVIAVGITGWLAYDIGLLGKSEFSAGSTIASNGQPTEAAEAPQNMNGGSGEKASSTADSKSSGDTQNQDAAEQNPEKPISTTAKIAEESRQSVYGLRGGAAPRAKEAYTIVVHSLRNESRARELNRELQTDGYRTILSRVTVKGATYWRVGLGQFKTIADAQKAASGLPEPYKNNHFIKRL